MGGEDARRDRQPPTEPREEAAKGYFTLLACPVLRLDTPTPAGKLKHHRKTEKRRKENSETPTKHRKTENGETPTPNRQLKP